MLISEIGLEEITSVFLILIGGNIDALLCLNSLFGDNSKIFLED